MNVVFSEIALSGLIKLFPDEDIREDYRLAIRFFLKARDAERHAFPMTAAYPGMQMYVRPLDNIRTTYQLIGPTKPIMVWTIKPLLSAD